MSSQTVKFIFLLAQAYPLDTSRAYERLFDDIFNYNNPYVLPKIAGGDPIQVRIDLSVRKISLDASDVLTGTYWIALKWKDPGLKWSPSLYDNITEQRIPLEKVWAPDITLINSLSGWLLTEGSARVPARLESDGEISILLPLRLSTHCPIRVYESGKIKEMQDCYLEFALLSSPSSDVTLTPLAMEAHIRDLIPTPCWILQSVTAHLSPIYHRPFHIPPQTVLYHFQLRKNCL